MLSFLPETDLLVQAWQKEAVRERFAWGRRRRLRFLGIVSSALVALVLTLAALHLQSIPRPLGQHIVHVHALPIKGGVPGSASWRLAGWQSWQSTYRQAQRLLIAGYSPADKERYRSLVEQLDRLPLSRYPVPPRILYLLQVRAYGHPITAAAVHYALDWHRERRLAVQSARALYLLSALFLSSTLLLSIQVAIISRNFKKTQSIYDRKDLEIKTHENLESLEKD